MFFKGDIEPYISRFQEVQVQGELRKRKYVSRQERRTSMAREKKSE